MANETITLMTKPQRTKLLTGGQATHLVKGRKYYVPVPDGAHALAEYLGFDVGKRWLFIEATRKSQGYESIEGIYNQLSK